MSLTKEAIASPATTMLALPGCVGVVIEVQMKSDDAGEHGCGIYSHVASALPAIENDEARQHLVDHVISTSLRRCLETANNMMTAQVNGTDGSEPGVLWAEACSWVFTKLADEVRSGMLREAERAEAARDAAAEAVKKMQS